MEHREAEELLEAYIIGALDSSELTALEKHLSAGCDKCDALLTSLYDVKVKLVETLPEMVPDSQLKQKILARISSLNSMDKSSIGFTKKYSGWLVAAALAASLVIVIIRMGSLSDDINALQTNLVEMEDVTSLLSSPGMEFMDLRGIGPNERAFGKVVYDKNKGNGVVYMYQLPQTPEGMQYQIWVMWDGVPTSAGTFHVEDNGSAVLTLTGLPDPAKIASFDVTLEPEGGLLSPTGMMYLTGTEVP